MEKYGETLYLTGSFDKVGFITGGAVFLEHGSDNPNINFPYVEGEVFDIIPDESGGWYIAGEFDRVNGRNIKNIVHILPDLTVDLDFTLNPNNTVNLYDSDVRFLEQFGR
jgi:hypothetical protein